MEACMHHIDELVTLDFRFHLLLREYVKLILALFILL